MSAMIERWSLAVVFAALLLGVIVGATLSDGVPEAQWVEGEAAAGVLTPAEEADLCGGTVLDGEELAASLGLTRSPSIVAAR